MPLIAILWYGLPYYAANVIANARRKLIDCEFVVISTGVGVPYLGIESVLGIPVFWVDDTKHLSWGDVGVAIPDVCIITSWNHRAYISLAVEARDKRSALVISMVDNYYRGAIRQWIGALYFRLRLRRLFSYMWVPGQRGKKFMRFLGMPNERILVGLYTSDPLVFFPPENSNNRSGVIFVGQFIPRKGIWDIIKFLDTEAGLLWRPRFRLIGHGPLASDLRSALIPVEPFMQAAQLAIAYRNSSALLLPSTLDHWGVVVHEAALSGCLILATRQCASVDDLVEHGVNGFIMSESSAGEIEAALNWLSGLSDEQINQGRLISIEKASMFSPTCWAETLQKLIVSKYT
jgi:glycosyltransferase involved in cell wall biosynthesis